MEQSYEILDAFVDGEAVDPAALKQALYDSAGRDYLVDAWLLRGLVQDELAAESASARPRSASPLRSWLIAASLAGVCLVGGYFAGARFASVLGPRSGPAPAESIGTPPAQRSAASAPSTASSTAAVPAATRVIRLELDPNWKETVGGR
jgi:hypothetical protein